jgi:hypothetical protein
MVSRPSVKDQSGMARKYTHVHPDVGPHFRRGPRTDHKQKKKMQKLLEVDRKKKRKRDKTVEKRMQTRSKESHYGRNHVRFPLRNWDGEQGLNSLPRCSGDGHPPAAHCVGKR